MCCYQCQERHVGCHSECEKYAEYRRKCDENKKARHLNSKCNDVFTARHDRSAKYRQKIAGKNPNWRGSF